MNLLTGLLLLVIGIIAGGYGTIVGAGGGFILVPALLILFGMDPIIAAGSGLVIVFINSLTGVLGYSKQKKINYKISFIIGISALPGALFGVWLLQIYSSQYFYVIFATLLVGLGVFLFCKNSPWKGKPSSDKGEHENPLERKTPQNIWLIPLGFLMGVLSSYLGIGGGWLLVPILIYVFNVPTHRAAATSILSLSLYSLAGAVFQIYLNNINWMIVIFGGFGVIIGANVGVFLSRQISGKVILQMLSLILFIIGIRLYFQ
ncbi:sulfite exporter TauE/SafE family protein [Ralstonia pickettii]|nr:sulfite exporter TauE/SafE family protein [Ralstonia pickettii]